MCASRTAALTPRAAWVSRPGDARVSTRTATSAATAAVRGAHQGRQGGRGGQDGPGAPVGGPWRRPGPAQPAATFSPATRSASTATRIEGRRSASARQTTYTCRRARCFSGTVTTPSGTG
ncbi:hypothetical protein SUDANB6_05084 [Streptomyces sp. enrichment culture]